MDSLRRSRSDLADDYADLNKSLGVAKSFSLAAFSMCFAACAASAVSGIAIPPPIDTLAAGGTVVSFIHLAGCQVLDNKIAERRHWLNPYKFGVRLLLAGVP